MELKAPANKVISVKEVLQERLNNSDKIEAVLVAELSGGVPSIYWSGAPLQDITFLKTYIDSWLMSFFLPTKVTYDAQTDRPIDSK